MPWNVGPHGRKFLVAPGRYVEEPDGGDRPEEAELVLWGEWEPPSRVVRRWAPSGRLPRVLHRPHWAVPTGDGFRQNTDPWVWSERMIYCCCKQTVKGRPNSLQRLTRGSVVCFGSTIDGSFCLDTVFVVASAEPWTTDDAEDMDLDEAFRVCTAASIASWERADGRAEGACLPDRTVPFTLYRGATYDDPVDGMFSWVPARRADTGPQAMRFPRPSIELPPLVNPASTQSAFGANRAMPTEDLRDAWRSVGLQVLAADLVLATQLQTPPCEGDAEVPGTARTNC